MTVLEAIMYQCEMFEDWEDKTNLCKLATRNQENVVLTGLHLSGTYII